MIYDTSANEWNGKLHIFCEQLGVELVAAPDCSGIIAAQWCRKMISASSGEKTKRIQTELGPEYK